MRFDTFSTHTLAHRNHDFGPASSKSGDKIGHFAVGLFDLGRDGARPGCGTWYACAPGALPGLAETGISLRQNAWPSQVSSGGSSSAAVAQAM